MKNLLFALILSVMCPAVFAQKITGKWSCTKQVTQTLKLGFEDVFCTYKFKKNGKMIIKIQGQSKTDYDPYSYDRDHYRRGKIVIKGVYSMHDGKISSNVKKEDIKCYANEINPPIEESSLNEASLSAGQAHNEAHYQSTYPVILRAKMRDYSFLWDWKDVPIEQLGKKLKIGDKLILK